MSPAEYRIFLKGLLMGLARGPVDESIITMIVDNAPGRVARAAPPVPVQLEDDVEVPPPPPADDPEGALEGLPGPITPEDIRAMKRLPKGPDGQVVKNPARAPLLRKASGKAATTPVGKDEDLKDAFSGGQVMRLG